MWLYFQPSIHANSLFNSLVPYPYSSNPLWQWFFQPVQHPFSKLLQVELEFPFWTLQFSNSHLYGFLAIARICLIHLPLPLFLQLINYLFFHHGPVDWGSYLFDISPPITSIIICAEKNSLLLLNSVPLILYIYWANIILRNHAAGRFSSTPIHHA